MSELLTVALFGEAEKGEYRTPYYCKTLPQLVDYFGHPPPESHGLFYAVQTLMYHHDLIFFRVKEEGFSKQDYYSAFRFLEKEELMNRIVAYCLPGVGDSAIIDAVIPICCRNNSIVITTEPDLYDYLTGTNFN